MSEVVENIQKFKKNIPENVTLVAVSKTKPMPMILEAYEIGHRVLAKIKCRI